MRLQPEGAQYTPVSAEVFFSESLQALPRRGGKRTSRSLVFLGGSLFMRWLMIGLLVSLAVLLLVAAGVTRHVWVHRRRLKRDALDALETGRETDLEIER